ncbi:MAG: hypothetical protein HC855_10955 [Rhizobiales bacterium]|nr:hypothetical protein [Hyphomicrobiales bacterium]
MAFHHKRFGEMFSLLGGSTSAVSSPVDKVAWSSSMEGLAKIRLEGTIGQVLDYMIEYAHPRPPDTVLSALDEAAVDREALLRLAHDLPRVWKRRSDGCPCQTADRALADRGDRCRSRR